LRRFRAGSNAGGNPPAVNILLVTHFFYPSVGGTETVARILAEEFTAAGHAVKVITTTPAVPILEESPAFPFEIVRRPDAATLLAATRWSDVVLHNNPCFQSAWPLLAVPRPWLVTAHVGIPGWEAGWRAGCVGAFKRALLRRVPTYAVSRALAHELGLEGSAPVVPNPYRDDCFHPIPGIPRERDLLFVGRLVSDKGADRLVRALARLHPQGRPATLTIVGTGPEENALKALALREGVDSQIVWAGQRTAPEITRLMHAHRVLAIPSRWAEPFGLVALEGIACGCFPVGSHRGGLPEAIGPCGLTFESGLESDSENRAIDALTARLDQALGSEALRQSHLAHAAAHLQPHRRASVAAVYLDLLEQLRSRR